MASQRTSDENLNPQEANTTQTVEKRRLSAAEKRQQTMFEKSGMKKGALFKFLRVKKKGQDPEEGNGSIQPSPAPQPSTSRVMAASNNNNLMATPPDSDNSNDEVPNEMVIPYNNDRNHPEHNNEEEDGLVNYSQSSSVIFDCEVDPKANKNVECVDIPSDEEAVDGANHSRNNNKRSQNNTLRAEKEAEETIQEGDEGSDSSSEDNEDIIPENEVPSDPSPENRPDYSSSNSDEEGEDIADEDLEEDANPHQREPLFDLPGVEPAMTTPQKVETWKKKYMKRTHSRDDDQSQGPSFQPTASKTCRQSSPIKTPETVQRREETPTKSSVMTSSSAGAPIKIIRTYSLNENSSSSNDARASTSSNSNSRAKKVILRYKETKNPEVKVLIHLKSNWKRALDVMKVDLSSDKLPEASSVSVIIRKAVLCDGTRVAKQVQSDSLEFLEKLVEEYPPLPGDGKSVEYYKRIFEKVFDAGEFLFEENIPELYQFFKEICRRVEADLKSQLETNTLWLLVFVTELVVNQFNEYSKEAVKVKPPLFRFFVEHKDENRLRYEPACSSIVKEMFQTTAPEMRCIYMKWFDLIVRTLGSSNLFDRENQLLITDVAQKCKDQSDLGLSLLLNLDYKEFGRRMCEKIFDRFHLSPQTTTSDAKLNIKRRNEYLEKLAEASLIKPAEGVITDLCEETCTSNTNLTFKRTRMEYYQEGPKKNADAKRKNVKGETRLHHLCNTNTIDNLMDEIRKHVRANPEEINQQDNYGNTPLHDCAAGDKGDIIRELTHLYRYERIAVPVNFLIRNKSLETPMHLAAIDCMPETVDKLKGFAKKCGVLQDVLMAPNGEGKLPFEVGSNKTAVAMLKLPGYSTDIKSLHQKGILLSSQSLNQINTNFALRKIIAWWKKNKSS